MTATATPQPTTTAPPLTRRGGGRARIARLERPLFLTGLALVTAHLLDLALSGPDPSVLGIWAILAIALVWGLAQPRLIRPTRIASGIAFGMLTLGFGVVSHGLHVVNSGPDLRDVTGVGMIAGGVLLVVSGLIAIAAPRRAPRRPALAWRAAHGIGWLAGAVVAFVIGMFALAMPLMTTHAPRWEIQETSLGIPHEEVRIAVPDGSELSGWYVPSRNRTAVLLSHGSGGSRERVMDEARMLARNGYGVLAFDLRGNGESDGHSNGLGDNAQPAVAAALGWLSSRPDVDPDRIAGFGSSLGGEVLLEAAARDPRLRAVVSDGSARPRDATDANDAGFVQSAVAEVTMHVVRGISGMRSAPSLYGVIPRIAPRPVLLIASTAGGTEIPTNREYRDRGGPTVELWEIPEAAHTSGLSARPAEYERRTTAFLDRALGL